MKTIAISFILIIRGHLTREKSLQATLTLANKKRDGTQYSTLIPYIKSDTKIGYFHRQL